MSEPQSTDAPVHSPVYIDPPSDEAEGSPSLRSVMINRPRAVLYGFWRDLTNFPVFMATVKSVVVHDDRRSTWTVEGPGGVDIILDSQITEDRPNDYIAWRSTEGGDVDHEGWVSFTDNPFGRGVEVRLMIRYDPPAGAVGKMVAKVLQREPRVQARRELRRFKQLMETGEIPTSQAPHAASRAERHF